VHPKASLLCQLQLGGGSFRPRRGTPGVRSAGTDQLHGGEFRLTYRSSQLACVSMLGAKLASGNGYRES